MNIYRVGVQLQSRQITYNEFVDAVRRTEALGIAREQDWDYFSPLPGDPAGNHFDGWTMLSEVAMLTHRSNWATWSQAITIVTRHC